MHDDEFEDVDGGDQDLEGDPFDDEDPDAPNLVPEAGPSPRVLPGGIELRELIGEGGMGQVYLGFHLTLGLDLAVKVLDPALSLRADSQERLLREGLVLASIHHENVVKVYHCDRTTDGRLFIVMELLRGETLRQLRARLGAIDALEVVEVGLQICKALEVAHACGVIHRDITPSNVMVLREPEMLVKVIDFGICRLLDTFHARHSQRFAAPPGSRMATPAGVQLGNPEYMAPELFVREPFVPPNVRTDVFSVAVVLFELLTDMHPFRHGDRKQARTVREVMPDFEYIELEQALVNALRCDPERRTSTMAALREDLELAHDCIVAQRGEEPDELQQRPSARLLRLDRYRPSVHDEEPDEPRARFLEVVRDGEVEHEAPEGLPLAPVVVLRAAPPGARSLLEGPVGVGPGLDSAVAEHPAAAPESGRDAAPERASGRSVQAAACLLPLPELAPAASKTTPGWFMTQMSGLLVGTGLVVGVGATLASQQIGESMFTAPARLAEVEAAAGLCEQALDEARASLAQVEQDLLVARKTGSPVIVEAPASPMTADAPSQPELSRASTAAPAASPVASRSSPDPARTSSQSRHRSVRRSLDKVTSGVRGCYDEAGGGRLTRLDVRVRIEADGQASAVDLPGGDGSSIALCVAAAIRTRRYAAGDEAEWIRHAFVLDAKEETP